MSRAGTIDLSSELTRVRLSLELLVQRRLGLLLAADALLVFFCHVGERSMMATYFLMYQGYTQVASMKGGIAKWVHKGFPVSGPAAPAVGSASAQGCGCSGKSPPSGAAEKSSCCASADSGSSCC